MERCSNLGLGGKHSSLFRALVNYGLRFTNSCLMFAVKVGVYLSGKVLHSKAEGLAYSEQW